MRSNFLDRVVLWFTSAFIIGLAGTYLIAPPPPTLHQAWRLPSWIVPSRTGPSSEPTAISPVVVSPPSRANPVSPESSELPKAFEGSPNSIPTAQAPVPESLAAQSSSVASGPRAATIDAARYTVQVGALRFQENAKELVQQLQARGFTPTVTHDGLYRVRVGQNLERDAAVQLAAHLHEAGFDTYVTSR